MAESLTTILLDVYARLHHHYGFEPHWWPIFTQNWRWETMLGAILVQQGPWERTEQAIMRLDTLGLVDERALADASLPTVVEAIRSVAYYNAKGPAIQRLARYIVEHYDGDTANIFNSANANRTPRIIKFVPCGTGNSRRNASICGTSREFRGRCLATAFLWTPWDHPRHRNHAIRAVTCAA